MLASPHTYASNKHKHKQKHKQKHREEEVFDREAILGRDVTSVFPIESRKVDQGTLEEVLGANFEKRFVTASQLKEIKAMGGGGGMNQRK